MAALLSRPPRDKKPKFAGDPDEYRLTLIEHLEELRGRIIKCLLLVSLGWALGWWYYEPIYNYFDQFVMKAIYAGLPNHVEYKQPFDSPMGPFLLQLHLSFWMGVLVTFPFLVLQLWGFIAPALKENEQKPFRRLVPLAALLFVMGAGFAWYVTPSALKWFGSYFRNFPNSPLYQAPGTMVFFVLKLLLAFGVAFQLPLVVYGLGMANLLSAETLLKYWRQASVAIFIIASVVTPSNDPVTMLAMAIPLVILFIISVYAVKFVQRDKPPIDLD